jgi:hypothetical protein
MKGVSKIRMEDWRAFLWHRFMLNLSLGVCLSAHTELQQQVLHCPKLAGASIRPPVYPQDSKILEIFNKLQF